MKTYGLLLVFCFAIFLPAFAETPDTHNAKEIDLYDVPVRDGCYCSEGVCPLHVSEDHWAFLDEKNVKILLDKAFTSEECPVFKEGLAALNASNAHRPSFYVNKSGEIVSKHLMHLGDFENGYALGTDGANCYSISIKTKIATKLNVNCSSETYRQNGLGNSESRDKVKYLLAMFPAGTVQRFSGDPSGSHRIRFYDAKGKVFLVTEGENGQPFTDGLAWVSRCNAGCKWGAVDASGKTVIPFMYTVSPGLFSEGMAAVYENVNAIFSEGHATPVGFIDKTNQLVIPTRYAHVLAAFHDGTAIVTRQTGRMPYRETAFVIDVHGNERKALPDGVSCNRADEYCTFQAGGGGVGLIDRKGNLLIPDTIFQEIGEFGDGAEGLAMAHALNDMFGYINLHGEFLLVAGASKF